VILEAQSKRNELNWLLKTSFPSVCEELWQNFDDCIAYCDQILRLKFATRLKLA